jgi:GNAT superfamily N-acetyltransferase
MSPERRIETCAIRRHGVPGLEYVPATVQSPRPLDIRPLEQSAHDDAATLLADAFVDDPGWLAVGPDRRARRHSLERRFHRAALAVIHRHGRPTYGAYDGNRLVGVAATFAAGLYPPPAIRTTLRFAPAFVAAGPGPLARGLRFSAIQEKGHPHGEHVYLWFLAVDPRHQRGGVGRSLLARVCEEATAPVYLDTANPDNVPYYASNGFEEIGKAAGPRGATMWFMVRAHPAEPGASGL